MLMRYYRSTIIDLHNYSYLAEVDQKIRTSVRALSSTYYTTYTEFFNLKQEMHQSYYVYSFSIIGK